MTNYGFLIDQSKCIGCHACSTACKSENQVPLGVNRTWVKYVETGAYPDVRRRFQVTRCNHCANPPCVRICPVTAMYQRDDGIVEFDPSICIGCKSCMQACPYDSIYLDPETNTAAKCTFCAHRLDVGLEPACVVVCPEHAILAGDLNDPASEISRKLSTAQATVRKPEQGTGPKLFYINGNDWSLHPSASPAGESYVWADKITEQNTSPYELPVFQSSSRTSKSGTPLRAPQEQGRPLNGPIQIGGRVAEQMVQTAYNAQHKIQWHWELPSYLVTKNIAGGLFMLLSLGAGLGSFTFRLADLPCRRFHRNGLHAADSDPADQRPVTTQTLLEHLIAPAMEIMGGARRVHHGHIYSSCWTLVVTRRRGIFGLAAR